MMNYYSSFVQNSRGDIQYHGGFGHQLGQASDNRCAEDKEAASSRPGSGR